MPPWARHRCSAVVIHAVEDTDGVYLIGPLGDLGLARPTEIGDLVAGGQCASGGFAPEDQTLDGDA